MYILEVQKIPSVVLCPTKQEDMCKQSVPGHFSWPDCKAGGEGGGKKKKDTKPRQDKERGKNLGFLLSHSVNYP